MDAPWQDDFKYKAIRSILKRSMSVKTEEAVAWRRSARKYLQNFELQWKYKGLPTWDLDTEMFETLQRQAQKILNDFG